MHESQTPVADRRLDDASEKVRDTGRIYIDCTKTYFFGGGTGIQRVVTELSRHAENVGEELHVPCRPVVWSGIGFVEIGNHRVDRNRTARFLGQVVRRSLLGMVKIGRRLFRRHSEHPAQVRNRQSGPPSVGRLTCGMSRAMYLMFSLLSLPRSWMRLRIVRFQPNDTLVLPDANWSNMIPTQAIENIHPKGARLIAVMHDILPVRLPETFEPSLVSRFVPWLDWACANLDVMVCVSRATRDDLRNYFKEQHILSPPMLGTFQLGCDPSMEKSSPRQDTVRRFEAIDGKPWLLCVGTLEPRKNHNLLLDAYDRLWEAGEDVGLVIVGKVGWHCDDLIRRIQEHPQQGRNLHIFHDLNDSELDLAYRKSTGVVMPSLAEGLGLPVVEALRRHKPVIASDIPPHREMGRDCCTYFAPHDCHDLTQRIISLLSGEHLPKSRKVDQLNLPNWRDSTKELIETIWELGSLPVDLHDTKEHQLRGPRAAA